MTPATRKRQTAIGMISELYLPTPRAIDSAEQDRPLYLINYYANHYATGDEVADNIIKLSQLGRTDRWQKAIYHWSETVRNARNIYEIRHAFLQGMIYAGHASD